MKYIIFDSNNRSIGALDCYEADLAMNTPSGTTAVASDEDFKNKMLVGGAVVSIPDSELAAIASDDAMAELRSQRGALLSNSDFSQVDDSPFSDAKKAEWVTYRQQLRDLPANTTDPANPVWPSPPS